MTSSGPGRRRTHALAEALALGGAPVGLPAPTTAATGRYLRLRALEEVNGQQFTSVAELNVG
ncbi:hypothetical protein [Kitasatospora sp. NPDC057015]|uniref:hypothetical protein n=1 Tax=Kitasatospora sp. NPDC057015 TaxID=3346001 RepID=UPI003645807E